MAENLSILMIYEAHAAMQKTIRRWAGWAEMAMVLLVGCNNHPPPVYHGADGFHITPPAGWVERARGDAKVGRRPSELPLPPLDAAGNERLLVRYDRPMAGQSAWLRVSVADLPAAVSLKDCVADRSPGPEWKRASDVEHLEVNGSAAARIAFTGTWAQQDYVNETVAVRRGELVYFITTSFPASDNTAREKVRQAIAGTVWQ